MTFNAFVRGLVFALLVPSFGLACYGFGAGTITPQELAGCLISSLVGLVLILAVTHEGA